jgi:hypothetical protein
MKPKTPLDVQLIVWSANVILVLCEAHNRNQTDFNDVTYSTF